MFLLPLLPLPILFYCIKRAGVYFGLWAWLETSFATGMDVISQWCYERHDALVPVPIRGLYRVIHKVNSFIKTGIKDSIDTVSSCVVIFGLIIFVTCASVFIVFQVSFTSKN